MYSRMAPLDLMHNCLQNLQSRVRRLRYLKLTKTADFQITGDKRTTRYKFGSEVQKTWHGFHFARQANKQQF